MYQFPPRVLTLKVAPASEPLTLAEAKLFLRVDGSEEDALINSLITTARQLAETELRLSLVTQSWLLEQQYIPGEAVSLPLGPVQSVTQLSLVEGGAETVLSSEQYEEAIGKESVSLLQVSNADQIKVEYVAGFGDATAVPSAIKQGLLNQISHLYHNREAGEGIAPQALSLWQPYRRGQL